ncbi:MAG: PorV/PorQ family protein [Candidatus Marinimicrobia bacterium]|nr:PorV/PorQ family protein [Candidatus Neomarinimicrobiota bacterium]MCF7850401.1 PorV/PorQ family protein [Candidatus Neomarinimicrobiota bacterium]MCF7904550.1 PorV/PorQ family protein [Candidatus Neomarinimicrobiota bacterium]
MKRTIVYLTLLLTLGASLFGEQINRYGSTAASFLEIGVGSRPTGMGEAYVAVTGDLSSIYWNPASSAYLDRSSFAFMYQPWLVDISTVFSSGAIVIPTIGTVAVSMTQIGYGEMAVTNLTHQDGTGEFFTANEYALGLSYARKIATWFSFGATAKMINSQIWHESASAFALDLGVIVKTNFFAPEDRREKGLVIGMSISNYGTRMRYDGIDLLQPIDISIDETGNYGDVVGLYRTQEWELPLLFRIGLSWTPILNRFHSLTLAADALHPNNNAESVNVGGEYSIKMANSGRLYLRSGYKSLFLEDAEFGFTAGGGIEIYLIGNRSLRIDYAFKEANILGNTQAYTIGLTF